MTKVTQYVTLNIYTIDLAWVTAAFGHLCLQQYLFFSGNFVAMLASLRQNTYSCGNKTQNRWQWL